MTPTPYPLRPFPEPAVAPHADTLAELDTQTFDAAVFLTRDASWEAELLTLLMVVEPAAGKVAAGGPPAVRAAVDLVRTLDQFAERAGFAGRLAEARAAAADFAAAASEALRIGWLSPRRAVASRDAVKMLPAAVEGYLLAMGTGFATGRAAAAWVGTAGVFLKQLRRAVR